MARKSYPQSTHSVKILFCTGLDQRISQLFQSLFQVCDVFFHVSDAALVLLGCLGLKMSFLASTAHLFLFSLHLFPDGISFFLPLCQVFLVISLVHEQSAILDAEGKRQAAFLEAEARERLAEAEAKATHMVSQAIAKGDLNAINYFVATKYVEALQSIAMSPNEKLVL